MSVAKPQWKLSVCPLGCSASLTHRSFQALFCWSLLPTAQPQTLSDSTGVHHHGGFSSRAALTESNTQQPLPAHFRNQPSGHRWRTLGAGVENTYKGSSRSSSLIWTREFLSPKPGFVKACGALLPLLSLLGILLCFDGVRGPRRRRAGPGSLTHPSVFPVPVVGTEGSGAQQH